MESDGPKEYRLLIEEPSIELATYGSVPTNDSETNKSPSSELLHSPLESTAPSPATEIRLRQQAPQDDRLDQFNPQTVEELLSLKPTRSGERDGVYLRPYTKLLLLLAFFYSIPALQVVINDYVNAVHLDQVEQNCYFNWKCKNKFWIFEASNNVVSNAAYVISGIGYVIFVKARRPDPFVPTSKGLHRDYSLYYCLGWCLLLQGLFSAIYHICPSSTNFQFDTTFMIIGAFILFVSIYQKRHGILTIGPFKSYLFLGIIVLLNVVSLIDMNREYGAIRRILFWIIVFILLFVGSYFISAYIYYNGRYALREFKTVFYNLTHFPPSQKGKFVFLLAVNFVNFGITIGAAIYTSINNSTNIFPNFTLGMFLLNGVIYISYYIAMKFKSNEKIPKKVIVLFLLMLPLYLSGFYFFQLQITDKFLPPEQSRLLNQPCVALEYFDTHDLWHFLSAGGLLCSMLIVYFLDENIADVERRHIHVF